MEFSFESIDKSKTYKQKSLFSQQSKHLEEDNNDCQQSHQGDQDLSHNCSLDGYNASIQNIKGQETIRQLQIELPISDQRNSVREAFSCSLTNSKRKNSKLDLSSNYGSQQIIKNKEYSEIDPQEMSFIKENIVNQEVTNIKTNSTQYNKLTLTH
ncbi:hypothetical protein ABPG72_001491 [Tetrahymena utriculariae]